MRKSKIYLLMAIAMMAISCNEDIYSFGDNDFTEFYLSDLSSSNYPSFDNWVIMDSTSDTDEFDGFMSAILEISETSSRKITVSFPYLDEVPSYAIFGQEESIVDDFYTSCLVSVSADAATSVGIHAFSSCTALTSISFAEATAIDYAAFANCESLVDYNLPKVESIGSYMFAFSPLITDVDFAAATAVGSYAFMYCSALSSVSLPLAETLGNYAFWECDLLESVSLPSLTGLGAAAFYSCDILTTVDMPLVQSVGASAFGSCTLLSSVSMPLASTIGSLAFMGCSSLTQLSLPSLTYLGDWAFNECSALTTLEIATGSTPLYGIDQYAFGEIDTTQVALTIGSANSEYVDGNTLSIGNFSAEFASITIQ